jgi:hypothetical protein
MNSFFIVFIFAINISSFFFSSLLLLIIVMIPNKKIKKNNIFFESLFKVFLIFLIELEIKSQQFSHSKTNFERKHAKKKFKQLN